MASYENERAVMERAVAWAKAVLRDVVETGGTSNPCTVTGKTDAPLRVHGRRLEDGAMSPLAMLYDSYLRTSRLPADEVEKRALEIVRDARSRS